MESTEPSTPQMESSVSQTRATHPMFIHADSAANALLWMHAPLKNVGNTTVPLSAYPTCTDMLTRFGSAPQQLTSCAALAQSYVGSLRWRYSEPLQTGDAPQARPCQERTEALSIAVPTPAEIAKLPPQKQKAYLEGKLVYTSTQGFMTEKQRQLRMEKIATSDLACLTQVPYTTGITTQGPATPSTTSDPSPQSASVTPSGSDTNRSVNITSSVPDTTTHPYPLPTRVIATTHLPMDAISAKTPVTPVYDALNAAMANDTATTLRAAVRNSIVKDVSMWAALAKALDHDTGSFSDIAPMLRLALLAHSISAIAAQHDTTRYTLFRNLIVDGTPAMKIKTTQHSNIVFPLIAMPLDVYIGFLANNSCPEQPPHPFSPAGMDTAWTAIPMSNELKAAQYAFMYVMMFYASDTTYGRVSYVYDYHTEQEGLKGTITTVPASNLAYVAGHKAAILVMTDENASSVGDYVHLPWAKIPVYNGRMPRTNNDQQTIPPVDALKMWDSYFQTTNIREIRSSLPLTWEYMAENTAVGAVSGEALSQAAEFIMAARPGMFLAPSPTTTQYDTSTVLGGAHLISCRPAAPVAPITNGVPYLAQVNDISTDDAPKNLASIISGFNFASYSAFHIPPTGLVPVQRDEDGTTCAEFSRPAASQTEKLYETRCSTSTNRICAYVRLIDAGDLRYKFTNAEAMAGWLHMLAYAMTMNVSSALVMNDIPVRDWAGYNNEWGPYNRHKEISALKSDMSGSFITHANMEALQKKWSAFNSEWYMEYYGMEPYDCREWGSHSPVPYHLTAQWTQKLAFATVPTKSYPSDVIATVDHMKFAINISDIPKGDRLHLTGTINTLDAHPMVLDRTRGVTLEKYAMGSWIEQVHYISNKVARAHTADPTIFQTMTFTEATRIVFNAPVESRSLYLINSDNMTGQWALTAPTFSPITWPDPPSFTELLRAAKNYLILPALSAFSGFAVGGPVGAIASGVGHIVGQALDDASKNSEVSRIKQDLTSLITASKHHNVKNARESDDTLPETIAADGAPKAPVPTANN